MKKIGFKKSRLTLCLSGALLAGLLVVIPVICVKQDIHRLLSSWSELAFFVMVMLTGGALCLDSSKGVQKPEHKPLSLIVGTLYVFLYIALCALCQHINLTPLKGNVWPTVGVIFMAAGFSLLIWSRNHRKQPGDKSVGQFTRSGPYNQIRHPGYLSLLICSSGLPLVFGVWLPLLSLPGTFVALKWRIADQEEFLSREFSAEFADYKRTTWRILPHVF